MVSRNPEREKVVSEWRERKQWKKNGNEHRMKEWKYEQMNGNKTRKVCGENYNRRRIWKQKHWEHIQLRVKQFRTLAVSVAAHTQYMQRSWEWESTTIKNEGTFSQCTRAVRSRLASALLLKTQHQHQHQYHLLTHSLSLPWHNLSARLHFLITTIIFGCPFYYGNVFVGSSCATTTAATTSAKKRQTQLLFVKFLLS